MMQRTLVMIRHAKSSWANPLQSDFERPLNDRGEKDAPMMGEELKKRKLVPDLIISSTAKRAKQTAKKIAAAVGYDEANIRWYEKLYHCIPSVFEEVLYEVQDNVKTVYIVAHNPGITEFVNELSDEFYIDNMPTCAVAGIRFEADQWNEFHRIKKEVFLFEYPKNIK
ncbi:MAG: histidine phosphatase family protein [Bacteroidetes bacterium]|nr:histidine phosphatase family protein [Bacteroidota bacterium]MBS1777810.1 histidine phosphatase family protein [Bacteroidota bacterium]